MNLSSLLRALSAHEIHDESDVDITHIASDSRQVIPGALFVAIPGVNVDGARFIPQAIQRGAAAIVTQSPIPALSQAEGSDLQSPLSAHRLPTVFVPDTRVALAHLSAAWHDFPSRKLRVIGVTGTDGKTTTCTLAGAILSSAGHKVGMITSVSAQIGDQEIDTGFHTTTPDAPDVQRYLAQMVDAGAEYAVVEATSHGLAQHRLDAIDFDIAVVTNITHEHLDYHKTWENYRDAKALLFRALAGSQRKPRIARTAVLNGDDNERGVFEYLSAIEAEEQVVYSANSDFGIRDSEIRIPNSISIFARGIHHSLRGLRFNLVTPHGEIEIASPLIGRYNVSNILAAIGVGIARRVPFESMGTGIGRVRGLAGRMQIMQAEPFAAMVDFAHTPNALRVALETARETTRGRVIVVFGCAGLRDVDKRAMMGQIAGTLADKIVVTAEDPRTESLDTINARIAEGLQRAGRREREDYLIVDDRADAIMRAMKMARAGDVVMVTGKGHERSMCFGTTEHPWSDQDAVISALERIK